MSTILTPVQTERAIQLLDGLSNGAGCSFASSRAFKGGTCAQENGRGFDCYNCATRAFLREIGRETKER